MGPTLTYDRLDWHLDSAIEAGQPPENAFTHIGLYLAWLIRRQLHAPEVFPAGHVAAVKAGEMTGSDLADDVDGKLLESIMTAEGRAFSDACYGASRPRPSSASSRRSSAGCSAAARCEVQRTEGDSRSNAASTASTSSGVER